MGIGIKDILREKEKLRSITDEAIRLTFGDQTDHFDANDLYHAIQNICQDVGVEVPQMELIQKTIKEINENGEEKLLFTDFQILLDLLLETIVQLQEQ